MPAPGHARARRRPGQAAGAPSDPALRARRLASVPTEIVFPPELPVTDRLDDLGAAICDHQVVIVAGETGSGKTTQLPKLCLKLGRGVDGTIAHTQPRRIAARTVAQRIAEELDVPLGTAVGYAVRFENKASDDTLIRLVTDGLLLAEIQRDRLLRRYDTIIVDEAHERSLNIDFLLGYLQRILPQRPDLKVIITSATIDSDRFAAHFGGAPVVEVSGRTYPVQVRYRPLSADDAEPDPEADDDEDPADARQGHVVTDRDQAEAIVDAVDELEAETPGDVLVFLSGEREIRDAADALAGHVPSTTEVLPLYARLSTAEQQRVFRRGDSKATRRIVLATNVAETSLTVPGIRYVIDAGTARVSRYSARLKVQRLPIEPVSQASASQRAGRCGRTSDGICIRLYSETDFRTRPEYTDPEIVRTSLAAVILQMALLGLGAIEDYPFLDPPDRRQIRDGVLLLRELGALEEGDDAQPAPRLTPDGRRLAQLPVDPRLARMVLASDRLDCAEEVIVIVAALSIQDPRIRPSDERGKADQLHARFKDEHSDFLAYLNLWRYLEEQQVDLSRSKFRKRCKAEYLHHLRIREWQDLVARLRQGTRSTKITLNQQPGTPAHIHQALLSGLLSHVGLRDPKRREYQGARGSRFAVFPGSALARGGADWIMAAELVETSRLWGRTVARIDPRWIEPLAGTLLKRTYSEPRWDRRKAAAVATERATLYGLPVITGRTVAIAPLDPVLAREMFIRHALVEDDWDTHHEFAAANLRVLGQARALEDRARRRDLLAGEHVRLAFFDERLPAHVVSGPHFDRWWRKARPGQPERLTYTRDLLLDRAARAELDPQAFPTGWRQGEALLRVSYRFDPGADDDGLTVHIPLDRLGGVRGEEFAWLVPGLRHELVTALIRGLPKDLRRPLVPVPDTATAVLAAARPRREGLLDAVGRELERQRGVRVDAGTWDTPALPAHLRPAFQIESDDGTVLARGDDLEALRAELRPTLQRQLAAATPELQVTGLTGWSIGTLDQEVHLPGTGGTATAYPALVDEGATAGVRVLDSPDAQAHAMREGTRRLLLLTCPSPARWVRDRLDLRAQVALAEPVLGGLDAVLEDTIAAAVDHLVQRAGGPAWDAEAFARLRGQVAGDLANTTAQAVAQVVDILELRGQVIDAVAPLVADAQQEVRADIHAHLARLVHRGFLTTTGVGRLADVERYLTGILRRLERLRGDANADAPHLATVREVEAEVRAAREAWPAGRAVPESLADLPWLLEELRVSLFAQGLGTKKTVSPKRVRKAIAQVTAG